MLTNLLTSAQQILVNLSGNSARQMSLMRDAGLRQAFPNGKHQYFRLSLVGEQISLDEIGDQPVVIDYSHTGIKRSC